MNQQFQEKSGANDIRIQPYPVKETGNDSFPLGIYEVTHSKAETENSFVLNHEIQNMRLIADLIQRKKAVYACAVASPRSAFREVQYSENLSQQVIWDEANLGESPYFTPMIICKEETICTLDHRQHDTHPDWDGVEVIFPKGACLARNEVLQLKASGMKGLLSLIKDENIQPGSFAVGITAEGDFKFIVRCASDLRGFMQNGERDKRRDIMVHMITACFAKLKNDYKDEENIEGEGWRSYKALVTLAKHVEEDQGINWSDGNFQPELAATSLYPHHIPELEDSDD